MAHDEERTSAREAALSSAGHAADAHAAEIDPLEYVEPPEEALAADEKPTPSWVPLLGLSLGLLAIFGFLVTRPAPRSAEELAGTVPSAEAAPAAAAAAPPNAAPAARPRPGPPGQGTMPGAPPGARPPPGTLAGPRPPAGGVAGPRPPAGEIVPRPPAAGPAPSP